MRKLMVRLILWLCNRFDVWPMDEQRIFMGEDAKARSHRWEAFAKEQGGLFDMIEALRRETFEQYGELPPSAHDERVYLALSDRNLRRMKQRVNTIIAQGKIQERNEARPEALRILKSV